MNVTVNDARVEAAEGWTIADLLEQRGQTQGVAVAVNQEFVPRARYATRVLQDGDEVEIVAPMQGG